MFLTYKRRRQSLTGNFIHGNCNHHSVCEDAHNDNQTVEKTSEKHEEKTVRFLKPTSGFVDMFMEHQTSISLFLSFCNSISNKI